MHGGGPCNIPLIMRPRRLDAAYLQNKVGVRSMSFDSFFFCQVGTNLGLYVAVAGALQRQFSCSNRECAWPCTPLLPSFPPCPFPPFHLNFVP